ncbi:MAG: hypothetical protein IT308_09065 [Anaerolineaceae bacterium]|nr:hypothetical protein [Anaerolineaceae bacterium]
MPDDLKQARKLIQTGEWVAAQKELISILQSDPRNEAAWFLLVKALPEAGDKLSALRACVKSNPQSARARKALETLQIQTVAAARPVHFPEPPDPDNVPLPEEAPPPVAPPLPPKRTKSWRRVALIALAALTLITAIILLHFWNVF